MLSTCWFLCPIHCTDADRPLVVSARGAHPCHRMCASNLPFSAIRVGRHRTRLSVLRTSSTDPTATRPRAPLRNRKKCRYNAQAVVMSSVPRARGLQALNNSLAGVKETTKLFAGAFRTGAARDDVNPFARRLYSDAGTHTHFQRGRTIRTPVMSSMPAASISSAVSLSVFARSAL